MTLPPRLSDRLRLLQWLLPPAIALVAVFYQLGPASYVHDHYGHAAHYAIEILMYGTAGPGFVYLTLRVVRGWMLQKERAESEVYRLNAELRARVEERGELLGRLLTAQEDERRRLARELHDELGQGLSSMALTLELAQRMADRDPQGTVRHIDQTRVMIAEASDQMYDLILGLRPSVLDDLGLVTALQAQAKRTLEPAGITYDLEAHGLANRLPPTLETILFRIFQEALSNVQRHAKARHVHLRLARDDGILEAEIQDDGAGFDSAASSSGPWKGQGLGLMGMRERAAQCGGDLEIDSRPGHGTCLRVRLPVPEPAIA
jgi:signal transduction histidine kinase